MNTPQDLDPFSFNDRLRSVYDDEADLDPTAPLPPRIWAGVRAHLAPVARPTPRRAPLLAGVGGLVVGALLMLLTGWWRAEPAKTPAVVRPTREWAAPAPELALRTPGRTPPALKLPATTSERAAATPELRANPLPMRAITPALSALSAPTPASAPAPTPAPAPAAAPKSRAELTLAPPAAAALLPVTGGALPEVSAILRPLVQAETALAGLGADTARTTRERRRVLLLTERAVLANLNRRTDSLLLTLDGTAITRRLTTAGADSVASPAPLRRRWSVALTGAPELSFLGLQAPAADTLSAVRRTHEQGRGGFNAALLAEYRLGSRWSVAAGAGLSSTGAELRLTDRRTLIATRLDSTIIRSVQDTQITTRAYSVRIVLDPQVSPRVNFNNQIIGYDTVYVPRNDTVWTYLTTKSTFESTHTTYTPIISTREEVRAQVLRPTYRFLTVPLLVRYRLGRATDWTSSPTAPRWWADVAVGTQLQFFLGGTQLLSADGGRTYRTARVRGADSPFRPLSVAVLGQVAMNYALTPRLSASLAPTVRWQAQSIYRPGTGLGQRPTTTGVQLGLRWAF